MRLAIRIALAAGLWLVLGLAWAQRVEGTRAAARGIYQAEVSVNSQRENERKAGFSRALAQVLGKLTGDRGIANHPGVAEELRRAGDYVDSYDYRQDEGLSPTTGAPTYGTTLIVRFEPERIDDIAAALGLPVWAQPRPKPVLWLAIDDGSGARLVGLAKADAARPLLDRAIERGYRLGLPGGSAAEQAAVGAIWRGDAGVIARLSGRYQPPLQLIGKLFRSNGGWHADWIFVDHGRVLSRWSSDDASARRTMAAGADGAADALVAKYAKAAPVGAAGTYRVRFTGIHDARDYMRLAAYLRTLSVVQAITPVRAQGDSLDLDLALVSGIRGLRRVLDEELLQPEGGFDAIDDTEAPAIILPPGTALEPPTFRLR